MSWRWVRGAPFPRSLLALVAMLLGMAPASGRAEVPAPPAPLVDVEDSDDVVEAPDAPVDETPTPVADPTDELAPSASPPVDDVAPEELGVPPEPDPLLKPPFDVVADGCIGCGVCGAVPTAGTAAAFALSIMFITSGLTEGGWGGCLLVLFGTVAAIAGLIPAALIGPCGAVGAGIGAGTAAAMDGRPIWPALIATAVGLLVGLSGTTIALAPFFGLDQVGNWMQQTAGVDPLVGFLAVAIAGAVVGAFAGPVTIAVAALLDQPAPPLDGVDAEGGERALETRARKNGGEQRRNVDALASSIALAY